MVRAAPLGQPLAIPVCPGCDGSCRITFGTADGEPAGRLLPVKQLRRASLATFGMPLVVLFACAGWLSPPLALAVAATVSLGYGALLRSGPLARAPAHANRSRRAHPSG